MCDVIVTGRSLFELISCFKKTKNPTPARGSACCDLSYNGCPVATQNSSFKSFKITSGSAARSWEDELRTRVWIQPQWQFRFQGVKIEKRLGSSYYANVLMFYLEGEKSSLLILPGSCDKTLQRKRMFLFSFCTFHWLYLNIILCTKPYYARYGEKCAIWPPFLRLFIAVYFEFCQP